MLECPCQVRGVGEACVHGGGSHECAGYDQARSMLQSIPPLELAKGRPGRILEQAKRLGALQSQPLGQFVLAHPCHRFCRQVRQYSAHLSGKATLAVVEPLAKFSLRIEIELHPGQSQVAETALQPLRQRATTSPTRAVEVHGAQAAVSADDVMLDPRPDDHDIPGDRLPLAHDRERPTPSPYHARDGVRVAPDARDIDREHRARKGGIADGQRFLP